MNSSRTGAPAPIEHYQLGYRAYIEGLRAVAILLVVGAHANVPWLQGGFVGVDIFFVLSGYLITGLLVTEMRTKGRLDLRGFYARRLKRLLPAYLLLLAGVTILATLLLAPFEQIRQATTATYATVWASNFYFGFSELDYFSPSSATNLFLHTWSLSVEEQFYLVWPALVILLLGASRWQGHTYKPQRLNAGLGIVVVVGFLITLVLSFTYPLLAFYLMPSRAWQFALGAIVWLWSSQRPAQLGEANETGRSTRGAQRWAALGWVGLILIVGTAITLDTTRTYPRMWAVLPSLGAALALIAGGAARSSGAIRLLSIKPLQAIGHISYSWYLWHWPLLVFGDLYFGDKDDVANIILVLISLLIALCSYYVIETPIRRSTRLARHSTPIVTISAALIAGMAIVSHNWLSSAQIWSQQSDQQAYATLRANAPEIYNQNCDQWYLSAEVTRCTFGDEGATHTAVLFGDSVGAQWFPALANLYATDSWRLIVLTKSACPTVDEEIFYKQIQQVYTICSTWRDTALQEIEAIKPEIVFMGGSAVYPFSEEQWTSGTARILDRIAPAAKKVYVIRSTYYLPFDVTACLARRNWQPAFLAQLNTCSALGEQPRDVDIYRWLQSAASAYANVTVLDLNSLVCPNGRCYPQRNGEFVFRDSHHLRADFVTSLTASIAAKIEQSAAQKSNR